MRALLGAAALAVSCGARSSTAVLEGPAVGGTSSTGPADGSGGANPRADGSTGSGGARFADASTDKGPEPEPDAASDGEPTCADVGKYPGASACCSGKYCAGACFGKVPYCVCATIKGGCPWPLVCCPQKGGTCWSAEACAQ
jgi:hypothetical protein